MSSMPKRRIERVWSRVVATSVGTTPEENILHSAEDAKTLIRVLFNMRAWVTTDAVSTRYGEWVLSVYPASTRVAPVAGSGETLDQDAPLQELARGPVASIRDNTNGFHIIDQVHLDTKAMRKLKAGARS